VVADAGNYLTVSLGSHVLAGRQVVRAERVAEPVATEYLEQLVEVMQRVRREYVDQIDDRQLIESAIRGMVKELDDHSRYLDTRQYEDIRIATTGNYSGVGLDVSVEDGRVTVVSPLDDAPAAAAGIMPGDVLVSIDDVLVDESNAEETIGLMRGEAGTEVTLDVLRQGLDAPMHFALKRARIQVKTVRSTYLGDGYGYIRLTSFSDTTAADLDAAARALRADAHDELRGLVLDLRNNPGGVLDAAVDVADLFIDEGLIVRGTGRIRQARFEQYAEAGDALEGIPLTVLVNNGSASASEIVAGALKDHDRGRLVGERTYGKGSVQTVVPLTEGSAIKLTTSRYLTPLGRSINGIGIEPDVLVRNRDPRRQFRGADGGVPLAEDRQLQEALRLIGYDPIALSKLP
jgi:carboxyl-terminal processing protease